MRRDGTGLPLCRSRSPSVPPVHITRRNEMKTEPVRDETSEGRVMGSFIQGLTVLSHVTA